MKKGTQGYIDSVKRKNKWAGIGGIGVMLVIYFIGLIIKGNNGNIGTLLAVLMALPSAQMLARYFSLNRYHSLDASILDQKHMDLESSLYEVILVYGKQQYFIEAVCLKDDALYLKVAENPVSSKIMKEFLRNKGYCHEVIYIGNWDEFYSEAQNAQGDAPVLKTLLENAL